MPSRHVIATHHGATEDDLDITEVRLDEILLCMLQIDHSSYFVLTINTDIIHPLIQFPRDNPIDPTQADVRVAAVVVDQNTMNDIRANAAILSPGGQLTRPVITRMINVVRILQHWARQQGYDTIIPPPGVPVSIMDPAIFGPIMNRRVNSVQLTIDRKAHLTIQAIANKRLELIVPDGIVNISDTYVFR